MKMNYLIVTGGSVDYEWAKSWLSGRKYEYVIAADSGLEHVKALGLKPDYILGDYDSVKPKVLELYSDSTETVVYPKEKDFTDTHLAILAAINRGA
ncbi:MAG: thiamine diphosphokinase, partial [Lachnospira sp.]|nr:thiamine diphosphokinase [Lachnospira sp.]